MHNYSGSLLSVHKELLREHIQSPMPCMRGVAQNVKTGIHPKEREKRRKLYIIKDKKNEVKWESKR